MLSLLTETKTTVQSNAKAKTIILGYLALVSFAGSLQAIVMLFGKPILKIHLMLTVLSVLLGVMAYITLKQTKWGKLAALIVMGYTNFIISYYLGKYFFSNSELVEVISYGALLFGLYINYTQVRLMLGNVWLAGLAGTSFGVFVILSIVSRAALIKPPFEMVMTSFLILGLAYFAKTTADYGVIKKQVTVNMWVILFLSASLQEKKALYQLLLSEFKQQPSDKYLVGTILKRPRADRIKKTLFEENWFYFLLETPYNGAIPCKIKKEKLLQRIEPGEALLCFGQIRSDKKPPYIHCYYEVDIVLRYQPLTLKGLSQ